VDDDDDDDDEGGYGGGGASWVEEALRLYGMMKVPLRVCACACTRCACMCARACAACLPACASVSFPRARAMVPVPVGWLSESRASRAVSRLSHRALIG
jgi:hypothetical protein